MKLSLLTRAASRWVATFVATLMLAAQVAAVAHFHPVPSQDSFNAVAQAGTDSGLCPLCLLAFHSSANPPSTPSIATPTTTALAPLAPTASVFRRIVCACALTRAPPLAV
jgi:hypothetical protein